MRSALLAFAFVLASLISAPATAQERWKALPPLPEMPAPDLNGSVSHEGADIHYKLYGKGPPVVLLHGGLSNSEYWANQIVPLARTHRLILIDSRGHGRSSRDDRPYSYELMASDVIAVMDILKVQKAAVVGWSDGAIIGLVLALKHPDRLTRVFAFAANMDPSGVDLAGTERPPFTTFIERARKEYARLSWTPDDFDAFLAAIGQMWETQPNYSAADLGTIKVPVAIVDGDHDEAIKADHTTYLANTIPGAKLIWLKDTSHFAMLQDPMGFNAALSAFLDGP
jgi:pimeloyl-ACP methyl ester carboxylesterase